MYSNSPRFACFVVDYCLNCDGADAKICSFSARDATWILEEDKKVMNEWRRFGKIVSLTAIILVLLITVGVTSAHTIEDRAKEIADAIDYQNPVTRNYAVKLAAEYPGEYNIDQICSIYEHIHDNWKYVSDPRGEDYYASASETIENGLAGDCDDFAILMAATIEAIGGSSSVIIASGPKGNHAYAEVCVGPSETKLTKKILYNLANEYHKSIHYHTYSVESTEKVWLNLDWTANHPGGPFYEATDAWAIYPNGQYLKIIGPTHITLLISNVSPDPAYRGDFISIDGYAKPKPDSVNIRVIYPNGISKLHQIIVMTRPDIPDISLSYESNSICKSGTGKYTIEEIAYKLGYPTATATKSFYYYDYPRDSGFVSVSSDPSEAAIYLDETYKGKTPKTIPISPGTHTVRIAKSGYRDWSDYTKVESGKTKEMSAVLISISTPTPSIPAFEIIPAIATLLAVAYLLRGEIKKLIP